MKHSRLRIQLTSFLLVVLAVLFGGIFVTQHLPSKSKSTPTSPVFHGALLEKPRDIQPFSLIGIDNKPVTNQSIQGQWTMMFYGFTHCGGVCPTTMAMLAKMYARLETQYVAPLPRVMMITLDPERDSLNRLSDYVTAFHPAFYGARGEESAIEAMTQELGIVYQKVAAPQSSGDDIQHSGAILLFNPKGQLAAFFTPPITAKHLAADFKMLINQTQS